MPVERSKRSGPWKDGIRREASGLWTAKYGQKWSRGHRTRKGAVEARGALIGTSKRRRRAQETVREFAGRWVRDFSREAESTNRWNAERVSLFAQEHGLKRLSDVSKADAERFAREYPGRVASVKAMFNDAVKDGADGIGQSPFQHVRKPRGEGRQRITPLTDGEVALLVSTAEEVLEGYGRDVYAPMLLLAAWTGVRPAELFAVEWRDLDGDQLQVRRQWRDRTGELVEHTKNYDRRTVPLAPQVVEALERVPRIVGQEFVFFGRYGGRLSGHANSYYWNRVRDVFVRRLPEGHWVRDAKPLTMYALRHFFASEMSLRGVDTRDIASMLGHSDDGQLARQCYIHRREEDSRERVRRVLWEGRKAG